MPVIPVALLSLSTEEQRRAQKEEQLKLMVANLSGLTSSPLPPPHAVQRAIIRRQNNVFQGFFARKQRVIRWRVEIRLKMGWDGKAKIENMGKNFISFVNIFFLYLLS